MVYLACVDEIVCDPDTIRTCDPQLRRLLLYPLSYGAKISLKKIPANITQFETALQILNSLNFVIKYAE